MKKKICFGLAAVMLMSSLAGCGGKKETTSENGVDTITLWTNNSHSKSVVQELVNDWNNTTGKEKGIKIDYVVKGDDYGQQLALAYNADNLPDIFLQGTGNMIEEKKVIALNDYPEGQELIKNYDEDVLTEINRGYNYQLKDKTAKNVYTVPKGMTTYGLVYNKDMFKEAGIVDENGEAKPPKTYAEMVEDCKKLTDASKKQYGIIFPVKFGGWTTTDIVYPAFVSTGINSGYDRKTGTFDYSGIAPIMKAIMQIKHDGTSFPGAESLDNDPARAQFSEGRIGMKFSGSYDVGVFNNQFPAKCDWGVCEYPSESEDVRYKNPAVYGNAGFISSKAVERVGAEKVFEVYKWFTSDELARTLYIEGLDVPWKYSIIEDIADQSKVKGWKEFAQIAKNAVCIPENVTSKPAGFDGESIQSLCVNDFWYEKRDIDEALAAYSKACTEGIAAYVEENPDYDPSLYVDPNYDIRIK